MNRYRLVHTTEFLYDGPVSESYNEVRLRPIHDEKQSCLSFRLTTTPGSRGTAYRDAYGNWVHQFNVLPEHRRLKVEAESVVLAHDSFDVPAEAQTLVEFDSNKPHIDEEYFDLVAATKYVPHLKELQPLVEASEQASDGTVKGFAQAASNLIHEQFKYVKGATHVLSSIEDALDPPRRSLPGFCPSDCSGSSGCGEFRLATSLATWSRAVEMAPIRNRKK
jgi:transglutaminase-like putative cysteine protease